MSSDATSISFRDGVADAGGAGEIALRGGERLAPRRAQLGAWARRHALGLLALGVIVGCSLVLVLIAAEGPSVIAASTRADFFPGWMAGPLSGIWPSELLGTTALKVIFTAAIFVMWACYVLGMRRIAALGAGWAIGAIVAVQLIFFLSPPLTLTDVFNYINYARMDVVHNLDPYATIPALGPHGDPSYALSNWHDLLSPYGPLFTIFAFAVAPLSVAAAFWVAKGALALMSGAVLALVWKCARLLDRDPVQAIVFAGLNPIVLIWGMGGDHNDVYMVFFVMLACWLLLRSPVVGDAASGRARSRSPRSWLLPPAFHELAAGAALAAAVFVKASAGIVVPVILAAMVRTPRRLVQIVIGGIAGGVLLAAISYLVFGAHVPSDVTQGNLVTGLSIPNLLGLALGLGGETETLRKLLALVLIGAVALCSVLAWRRRDFITPAGWATLALLVALAWVLPWYISWALPLVALSSSRRLRLATAVLSVYLIVAWVPSASDWTGAIGLRPEKTPVGQQHQRVVRELLN
jgi:alpha-1,6-mannosyltransferase